MVDDFTMHRIAREAKVFLCYVEWISVADVSEITAYEDSGSSHVDMFHQDIALETRETWSEQHSQ